MTAPSELSADALLRQGRAMRAVARALLRNADDADEVVQDAWVVGLRERNGSPAWLAAVVHNLAQRRRRDASRRAALAGKLADAPAPPGNALGR